MKHKVVYNSCFGGFSLSEEAVKWLIENGAEETKKFLTEKANELEDSGEPGTWRFSSRFAKAGRYWVDEVPRHNKDLVAVVEALGSKANGTFADLQIEELSGNKYWIEEFDGQETVHEPETEEWITIED